MYSFKIPQYNLQIMQIVGMLLQKKLKCYAFALTLPYKNNLLQIV